MSPSIPRQVRWKLFAHTLHQRRPSPWSGRVGSCVMCFEAARRSLKLQPTCSQSRYNDPLHRRLQRLRHLYRCFGCYRVKRTSSRVGYLPLKSTGLSRRTAPAPLQGLHRYYRPVRPKPPHRYSRLVVVCPCASPLASMAWFLQFRIKPVSDSRPLYAGCRRPVNQAPDGLSQETGSPLVSTAPDTLTTRLRRVCLRSSFRHSPAPGLARDFSPTLTTTALYRSSSGWFETCFLKADPEGHPSSSTQLYNTISFHLLLLPCLCSTHPVAVTSRQCGAKDGGYFVCLNV